MTARDIRRIRLYHQFLASTRLTRPEDVVRSLVAVQAQDFAGAKWGIGQRMRGATDDGVERAFAEGRILRTHVMRPTWHFVAAADIRWLLALTGPRVHAANRTPYRVLGLSDADVQRSRRVLERALGAGTPLTRDELREAFRRARIGTEGSLRLAYYLMRAELDGVICSGPRRGRQFTYVLLDQRVPSRDTLPRDDGLAELAGRYFSSRGPAQLQDFAWWSGLTAADAKRGIEMLAGRLERHVSDGTIYWSAGTDAPARLSPAAHLLPLYDEYLIAYRDHRAAFDTAGRGTGAGPSPYDPPLVWQGQVVGTWARTLGKAGVTVNVAPFVRLRTGVRPNVRDAARRYARFLGMPLTLEEGGKKIRHG